jgi:hypothetical protein
MTMPATLLDRPTRELREALAPFADERRVAAARRIIELGMAGSELASVNSWPTTGWFSHARSRATPLGADDCERLTGTRGGDLRLIAAPPSG